MYARAKEIDYSFGGVDINVTAYYDKNDTLQEVEAQVDGVNEIDDCLTSRFKDVYIKEGDKFVSFEDHLMRECGL